MNEERLKELTECNKRLDTMSIQYPSPNEIEELATALLAAQKRVAELEKEVADLKDRRYQEEMDEEELG